MNVENPLEAKAKAIVKELSLSGKINQHQRAILKALLKFEDYKSIIAIYENTKEDYK